MKHDWRTTALMILLFVVAQGVGLHIISQYVNTAESAATGTTIINEDKYFIQPPQVENESFSFIPILIAILIGTALILLIAKFRKFGIWRAWFLLSIVISLSLAFAPYLTTLTDYLGLERSTGFIITGFIALALGLLKIFKQNVIVHNITEIFVYGGIAALFVPILNLTSALILLLLISAYDAYAVWKSKHMVRLATFQAESNLFAGLFIPKNVKKTAQTKSAAIRKAPKKARAAQTGNATHAVLGGGDIAFPLLFSGTVLKYTNSLSAALLISLGATIALAGLLVLSKKGRFYPAMPFISAGCFTGFLLTLL
ncbi:MAG: presenilin family intramembrane aspartyl protease [Nanoarchaeota archaeon]